MKKVYLVLEDGQGFEGYAFGAQKEIVGELVFNTSMVGYIETLTDPAYHGQIVVETFPMIGNYGIISADFESNSKPLAFVVREWCDAPSNFRCESDLNEYLSENGIVGIYGIDTREITKHLRENGTMNAKICYEMPNGVSDIKSYKIENAVEEVTCKEAYVCEAKGATRHKVVAIDYGMKKSFVEELCKRGCEVKVVPANTSAESILEDAPDGVFLSGGPGNPADCASYAAEVDKLFGLVPMFGVGLGHQVMAIARGASSYKLSYGHRGANQPSHRSGTNRTYITSQNCGYAIDADTLKDGVVSYENANDGTCEGIDYEDKKAFSVQFYPESIEGLHSTSFLYDKFISLMGGN